jgi:hypothetical protein
MKTRILLNLVVLLIAGLNSSHGQNAWTQKTNFGGIARGGAVGFSIGSKGYIGTGWANGYKKDFWEYDPPTDSWTQKADFGGIERSDAVGFSIGSKGYIGTGFEFSGLKNDFWEYDPATNSWTQKADFGGIARENAVGFSLGSKGYIGTGYAGVVGYTKDFWEFDPVSDLWTQKADFGGGARFSAAGFSIGAKGYLGTGIDSMFNSTNDFREYDPATNSWTQKSDFNGKPRYGAVGFSINNKGYIGTGEQFNIYKYDFYEYDPSIDTWSTKIKFEGVPRSYAAVFSIGNKAYIGTGETSLNFLNDFWEYDPNGGTDLCNIPTTLSTINITSTKATLNWNAVSGALSYRVRYKIASISEWKIIRSAVNDKILLGLSPGTAYAWQVKSICDVSPIVSSDWSEKQFFTTAALRLSELAVDERIFEVYPNPVSQSATVSFLLNDQSSVVIKILDLNGRTLKVIADDFFSEGNHELTFNRESLSAGIYFLEVKTNEGVMIKKVVIE